MKKLSPLAIPALKEALSSIYWYKSDLKSFLESCLSDRAIIQSVNWDNYKWQIVSDIVDLLNKDTPQHIKAMTDLCVEVSKMNSFIHLEKLEDGKTKVKRAKEAINHLKSFTDTHTTVAQEEKLIEERRELAAKKLRENKAVRERLDTLNSEYMALISEDPQKRGYKLEKLLYDLFELFDLDPKASFKNFGEQIDGAFSLDGTDYLFEAKWQQKLVDRAELDTFRMKIQRKLENTLGLCLSINGFETSGVEIHSNNGSNMLLMSGADLLAVFEGRIDFPTLLLRKKRHASQTGIIFLGIHEIL